MDYQTVTLLKEKGVGFRSMTEGVVDTTSPAGELIFSVFAALAQFEGGLIQERTQAGLGAVLRHYSYFRKLLTIPTASFNILFVLVILHHCRRKVVHFNVTSNPSAQWTAQQVLEAFPWDTAPKYLMRDRDSIYGVFFRNRVKNMGIKEVVSAPRSPWQNPFTERMIGSIRRECTDRVIV